MFARSKPRMDAVALLMLAILPLTGVITMNEALAGFADANVVLIALLFVIGEGWSAPASRSGSATGWSPRPAAARRGCPSS